MFKTDNYKNMIAVMCVLCILITGLLAYFNGDFSFVHAGRAAQAQGSVSRNDRPVFNVKSGFYAGPFELTVSYPDPDAKIYCTFDGSIPTADSEPYTEGFILENRSGYSNYLSAVTGVNPYEDYVPGVSVIKATVVRAIAVLPGGRTSGVASGTYFIGIDRTAAFGTAPVLSLYTDYDNLFSYDDGIYVLGRTYDEWLSWRAKFSAPDVNTGSEYDLTGSDGAAGEEVTAFNPDEPSGNYSNRGTEWERPATIEYMPCDGSEGFITDLGMRIMGGGSRNNTQKSFRLKCRKKYGSRYIEYDMIPGNLRRDGTGEVERYNSFVLRNGGNDCDYGKIRDPFIQKMVSSHDFETQDSEPVVLFIDGEYWGCYALCEDYSGHYIEYNYGIDENNVITVKNGRIDEGMEEDMPMFNEMMDFITGNDMSDPVNYARASEMLDMESFAGYCALNIYICNRDSIFLNDNNWEMWRVRRIDKQHAFGDGKWRMMCFDTDYSSGIYEDVGSDADIMREACDINGSSTGCRLLGSLLRNEGFRSLFITELCDMRNIDFEVNRVRNTIPGFRASYGLLVPYSMVRFGPEAIARFTDPVEYVNQSIDKVEEWFAARYDIFPEQIMNGFGLSEPVNVTVLPGDGTADTFKIDNSNIIMSGEYHGLYFQDVPVTVTAFPGEGRTVDHWNISNGTIASESKASVTLLPGNDCVIEPVYRSLP